MANHFITIAELEYEQANYLRKELQLENILAFIDFTGSDSGSLDKRIVRLQVQGKLVAKAIQALIKIVRKLNINSLNDLGEEQLKKSTTILVPVDLSERSEIVGKYAIKLASAIGAGIKFHHVYFESDGVSSSAAYEEFQETVHFQEELKAKQKLKTFTESVFNYANSLSFPVEEIHFGLSGGDVIDQLRDVTLASKPSLVLLGPKDEASDDYSAGVVRKVLHHIDCPILSLPLRDEVTGELPGRIVYISEDDKKLDEHLSLITDVFGNEVEIETLTANTELDGELLDYLVKTKTSIVVVDKPKTGAIGALFNKDLSDKMMKQETIPVLFLD